MASGPGSLGPLQAEGNSTFLNRVSGPGQSGLPAGKTPIIFSVWPTAGKQEAGAAGHSTGPVVLVLLTTGKGNGRSTRHHPCLSRERTVPLWRAGWVVGTAPGRPLSRENQTSSPPLPGGVGRVAGLCAGKAEEEGAAGAGRAGLPPAAPPGGCHSPLAVRRQHEGLQAAAARPAAGAGEPWVPHPSSRAAGGTRHDLTRGLLQAAHSLHRAVHRCAMLWKQKVLGQGKECRPLPTMPRRRVTFDSPLPTCVAAGAGDATLETRRPGDPHVPWGALGSLSLAAGDPQLLEL